MFGELTNAEPAADVIYPLSSGSGGASVKSGVKFAASWLAPLGFSIVDQITEATTLDDEVGGDGTEVDAVGAEICIAGAV